MEKLTEKINAIRVSKTLKDKIIEISEIEQLQIQQICRRLLVIGVNEYNKLKLSKE